MRLQDARGAIVPRGLGALAVCLCLLQTGTAGAGEARDWPTRLQAELSHLETVEGPSFGVFVRDLGSGLSVSHRAEERWYLASSVKVPVAIAVLQAVEQRRFSLDTTMILRASDLVDGAGPTNRMPVGSPLTVHFLLEQMIVHSDNSASDMLIGLVGLDAVNAVARSLAPGGIERITSLADVRRLVYAQLTPNAVHLSGADFLRLHAQPGDAERLDLLSHLLGMPVSGLRKKSLHEAYEGYYRSGLNSGRLDAFAELLARLATGQALGAPSTALLMATMGRVQTGTARIKAGLPSGVHFAHKTGTQRERVCDSGILTVSPPGGGSGGERQLVVAACVRGVASLARAEQVLRDIGLALQRAGALAL